jgi:hypothetical protein
MELKTQNQKKKTRSSGFTLLLAALVASIALSLGTAIYSIVSKELTLSSIGQDSQYAFYAADTAAECGLYWDNRSDIHPNTFATSSADNGSAATLTCDGQTVPITVAASSLTAATSTFEINLFTDVSIGYCADIAVGKSFNSGTHAESTLIIANGYNVNCSQVDTAPNALQRTVQLEY